MPKERQAFGEYLRQLRLERGLSLRALAAECGVSFPFISMVEDGQRSASEEVLSRLAVALDVEPEDLRARALGQLPSLAPYLRARYDLSETQVAELEAHFRAVTKKSPGGKRRRA